MKRWSVGVGLIVLGVACGMVGCDGKKAGDEPEKIKKYGGPGDSPVVVAGGAMTARTKDKTAGWIPVGNNFCTGITLTGGANGTLYFNYSDISNTVPGSSTQLPNAFTPVPKGSIPVTAGLWKLTIVGRNFVPSATTPSPSTNGIVITPLTTTCNGLTGASVYVQLSLTGGNNAGFYGTDANLKEDASGTAVTSKRFRDLTPYDATGKTSNCYGPNTSKNPAGDEDVCERASLVTLDTGTGATYAGWCTNGACILGLGDIEK